ncbi:hypothetical protein SERLA73DRAFT_164398 [Serpula lacrymans var. lacrymans S7.3]|uniref:Uncharacterized protein n=1 Tax=Serpula lacrymans var. lacrymans (strain S7.3) TaxID=936435 RepID=F8QJ05_SERL3|nr:hypothetical protein SERLA73DRAFT_164398 [Serpula lacrymans var. lacrymans S7.3]
MAFETWKRLWFGKKGMRTPSMEAECTHLQTKLWNAAENRGGSASQKTPTILIASDAAARWPKRRLQPRDNKAFKPHDQTLFHASSPPGRATTYRNIKCKCFIDGVPAFAVDPEPLGNEKRRIMIAACGNGSINFRTHHHRPRYGWRLKAEIIENDSGATTTRKRHWIGASVRGKGKGNRVLELNRQGLKGIVERGLWIEMGGDGGGADTSAKCESGMGMGRDVTVDAPLELPPTSSHKEGEAERQRDGGSTMSTTSEKHVGHVRVRTYCINVPPKTSATDGTTRSAHLPRRHRTRQRGRAGREIISGKEEPHEHVGTHVHAATVTNQHTY